MAYDFEHRDDIHLRQKIYPEHDLLSLVLLVVVLGLEYFAVVCLFNETPLLAALLHGVSFLLLFAYATAKERAGRDARFIWIAAMFLPVLGPVAPGGVLLTLAGHMLARKRSLTFQKWCEAIYPPESKSISETVYERITFGRDHVTENYTVTALMDVIKFGSDEKKCEAIFKISRYYNPAFAPILKSALEDPHNVVRVQAAMATAKIKNAFFLESMRLDGLKNEWPDEPALLLQLARHYDDYAFSGVLDNEQEQENRRLALQYYYEFLQAAPETEEKTKVRQWLGRLLLRLGMVDQAAAEFEKLKSEGHHTPDIDLWYSECLFYQKRYALLRALAASDRHGPLVSDNIRYADNIRGAIGLWGNIKEQVAA